MQRSREQLVEIVGCRRRRAVRSREKLLAAGIEKQAADRDLAEAEAELIRWDTDNPDPQHPLIQMEDQSNV